MPAPPMRNERAELGEIGAQIGHEVDVEAEEVAVVVERHLGDRDVVAALRVAQEVLGAVGGPVDRPRKCSAATAQSGYSRYMKILVPNPPPTSGVTTRMRWGSTFRMCLARISRMSWLPWLPRVRVQRFVDASNSATQARGSR